MKLFGTDGIRGKFGSEPITPQTILKLGWCIGTVFGKQSPSVPKVVIGKDTRISGYILESALSSGLLSSGVNVSLLGPVPTPAVSYFCRTTGAEAGVVISASHNPASDNGIKLISASGAKVTEEVQCLIEQAMLQSIGFDDTPKLGQAVRIDDAARVYSDYLCSTAETSLQGLRIVIDCANGASYRIAPMVLSELGAEIIPIGNQPDGYNINRQCGSTNPEYIRSETLKYSADVGIALDGDGDRVLMVDSSGNLINGDQILFIIAMARKRESRLLGGVVGTQMSNVGLERAFEKNGILFERTEVGDRFIAERLVQKGWNLGGEECGHILNGKSNVPGDGIAAALEVLGEIIKSGQTLGELVEDMELVPQVTVNIRLQNRTAPLSHLDLSCWPKVTRALEAAELKLNNHGRVLLRASGTEPIIRVLVEGDSEQGIEQIARSLAETVREESVYAV